VDDESIDVESTEEAVEPTPKKAKSKVKRAKKIAVAGEVSTTAPANSAAPAMAANSAASPVAAAESDVPAPILLQVSKPHT